MKVLENVATTVAIIVLVSIVMAGLWLWWGYRDLTYSGDPDKIAALTARMSDYAAQIAPSQRSEVHTWYFNKAQKYVSDLTVIDSATGKESKFSCTWMAEDGMEFVCSTISFEPDVDEPYIKHKCNYLAGNGGDFVCQIQSEK